MTGPVPRGLPEVAETCNTPARTLVPPVKVFDPPVIRMAPTPDLVSANGTVPVS